MASASGRYNVARPRAYRVCSRRDDSTVVAGGPDWCRLAGLARVAAAPAVGLARRRRRPGAGDARLAGRGPPRGLAVASARRAPRRLVRSRRRAALRARRPDGGCARHHHRRRDLLLPAAQSGLRSRPRRHPRVRLSGAAGAAEPLRRRRPDALVAAALPGGDRGRRGDARGRRRRRASGRRRGRRSHAALRPRRADQLLRDRRRRPGERACPGAPRSRTAGRVHDDGARIRRHAARLVHGLRGVDDPRGVVWRGRCPGAGGSALVASRGLHDSRGPLARRSGGRGVPDASTGSALRRRSGDADGRNCRDLAPTRDRRARPVPQGASRRRPLARAAGGAQRPARAGQRLPVVRPAGLSRSVALAVDRHAVLVMARPAVVDSGGLRRRRRHRGAGRAPSAVGPAGPGAARRHGVGERLDHGLGRGLVVRGAAIHQRPRRAGARAGPRRRRSCCAGRRSCWAAPRRRRSPGTTA